MERPVSKEGGMLFGAKVSCDFFQHPAFTSTSASTLVLYCTYINNNNYQLIFAK